MKCLNHTSNSVDHTKRGASDKIDDVFDLLECEADENGA